MTWAALTSSPSARRRIRMPSPIAACCIIRASCPPPMTARCGLLTAEILSADEWSGPSHRHRLDIAEAPQWPFGENLGDKPVAQSRGRCLVGDHAVTPRYAREPCGQVNRRTEDVAKTADHRTRGEADAHIGQIGIRANLPVSYTHLRAHETVLDIVC